MHVLEKYVEWSSDELKPESLNQQIFGLFIYLLTGKQQMRTHWVWNVIYFCAHYDYVISFPSPLYSDTNKLIGLQYMVSEFSNKHVSLLFVAGKIALNKSIFLKSQKPQSPNFTFVYNTNRL